jgi:hypothetical protein
MFKPLTISAPRGIRGEPLAARIYAVLLAGPKRWWDAQHTRDLLAELGEREWHDIGSGPREQDDGRIVEETDLERAARRRAIRAWYAHRHPDHPAKAA